MSTTHINVYILELKNSTRSNILKNQLRLQKIDFVTIPAVDGRNKERDYFENEYDFNGSFARLGYVMSPTLMACSISHKRAYIDFLKTKVDWALVFEEDAQLTNNFDFEFLNKFTFGKKTTPTIIQLFSRGSRLAKKKSWNLVNNQIFEFEFLPRLPGFGASAYLINQSAAKIAVKSEKISGPPDFPSWNTQVKFLGLYPWLTFESQSGSQINENRNSRISFWLRRLTIFTGIHLALNRKSYFGFKQYFREEFLPQLYYLFWKIRGSRFYSDKQSPQIL